MNKDQLLSHAKSGAMMAGAILATILAQYVNDHGIGVFSGLGITGALAAMLVPLILNHVAHALDSAAGLPDDPGAKPPPNPSGSPKGQSLGVWLVLGGTVFALTMAARAEDGARGPLVPSRMPALTLADWTGLQLPAPPATNAPPGAGGNVYAPGSLGELGQSVLGVIEQGLTNFILVPYYSRFSGITEKNGGGLGLFWPITTNGVVLYAGPRLQYVANGLLMPSGTVTLGVRLTLPAVFGLSSLTNVALTPILYSGVALPVSGQTVAGAKIPGAVLPSEFPIVGGGVNAELWEGLLGGKLNLGAGIENEQWLTTGISAWNFFLSGHFLL